MSYPVNGVTDQYKKLSFLLNITKLNGPTQDF